MLPGQRMMATIFLHFAMVSPTRARAGHGSGSLNLRFCSGLSFDQIDTHTGGPACVGGALSAQVEPAQAGVFRGRKSWPRLSSVCLRLQIRADPVGGRKRAVRRLPVRMVCVRQVVRPSGNDFQDRSYLHIQFLETKICGPCGKLR